MAALDRGEELAIDTFAHGSDPVEIRHKHDGCWEIWQGGQDDEGVQDVIHIEQEDWPAFLTLMHRATIGDLPAPGVI